MKNTRIYLLPILATFFIFSECRKQELRDFEDETTASCFNGIQDGDETGIDCGGTCGSCSVTPSCIVGSDTLQSSLSNGSTYYNAYSSGSSTQSTNYEAVIYFTSSYRITVRIHGTPDESIAYSDGDPFSLGAGQADVEYFNSGTTYNGSGGNVYVEKVGNSYKITACGYSWSNGFGTITGNCNFTSAQ